MHINREIFGGFSSQLTKIRHSMDIGARSIGGDDGIGFESVGPDRVRVVPRSFLSDWVSGEVSRGGEILGKGGEGEYAWCVWIESWMGGRGDG